MMTSYTVQIPLMTWVKISQVPGWAVWTALVALAITLVWFSNSPGYKRRMKYDDDS